MSTRILVSSALPCPAPAPAVDVVYVGERAPRFPAPIEVLAPAPTRTAVVVCGVRLGSASIRPFSY